MNRWIAWLMAAAALVTPAQASAAEDDRRERSPRILEPSFGLGEPRYFQKHNLLKPLPGQRPSRFGGTLVVPDPVPLEEPPPDGASQNQFAEPPVVPGQAPSPSYWYFCPDSQNYYPDVSVCTSGWRAFVPGTARPAY